MYQKKAFTILELVFAIAIGLIITTIAFLNYTSYNKSARDSSRLNDINIIHKSITLFFTQRNFYPQPSSPINVVFSGATVWSQGTIGDSVIQNLGSILKKPIDPLTDTEYTYSLSGKQTEFQVAAALEKDKHASLTQNFVEKTYAAGVEKGFARILGNYNGVITFVSTGGLDYGLALPSIISGDLSETDVVETVKNKNLAYDGFANVPSNMTHTFSLGGFNFIPSQFIVWSGSLDELRKGQGYKPLSTLLSNIYKNSILSGVGAYQNLGTDLEKFLNKTGNKKFSLQTDCKSLFSSKKLSHDGIYSFKKENGEVVDIYCSIDNPGENPFPTAKLSLDFVNNIGWIEDAKYFLSSFFTVTRNGTGTYIEDSGEVKTFGPNTLRYGSKGLLVEDSKTNLATYSQNLTTNWYNGTIGTPNFTDFTVTPNYFEIAAPDGTYTTTRLERIRSQANDGMFYAQNINMLANKTYTFSMWARTKSSASVQIKWGICCGGGLNNQPTITLEPVWKRFTVTGSVLADTSNTFRVITHDNTLEANIDMLVWGVQVEEGDFASSYIPTNSTPITRPRDVVSMTGTSFSNWYPTNGGTLYVELSTPSNQAGRSFISIGSNSADNNFAFRALSRTSDIQLASHNLGNGGNQYIEYINPGSSTSAGNHKIAIAGETNNFAGSINGSIPTTDTSGVLSSPTRLDIGSIGNSYFVDQMYIKRLGFWNERKSNDELKILTTP